MQPEIEAKFLDVNHDGLRVKLRGAGAVCEHPDRLTKRKNFDFPDDRLANEKHGWVRVRDEGDKITLSYKQLDNRELDGTQEVQLVVDSFPAAEAFVEALGLELKTYQETKRESWRLDGCEVELDEWPWAKPFVEIEGPDEQHVKALAAKLGLDWAAVCHGSVEIVYRAEYDVTDREINSIATVVFENPAPDWLQKRRRT